jgi:hypothetical protein
MGEPAPAVRSHDDQVRALRAREDHLVWNAVRHGGLDRDPAGLLYRLEEGVELRFGLRSAELFELFHALGAERSDDALFGVGRGQPHMQHLDLRSKLGRELHRDREPALGAIREVDGHQDPFDVEHAR